ncbi:hypothetical protein PanWU01x14_071840 [Parasponia andersonii]|uniref:Uncharacterized protein n=1 Tax=Parasponia andersonii TaxID=3476 RepID=A0A2P5DEM5_PARAD|nr:hypothetical protein PanWU01x14_071840 [Parasponia andersonii]
MNLIIFSVTYTGFSFASLGRQVCVCFFFFFFFFGLERGSQLCSHVIWVLIIDIWIKPSYSISSMLAPHCTLSSWLRLIIFFRWTKLYVTLTTKTEMAIQVDMNSHQKR